MKKNNVHFLEVEFRGNALKQLETLRKHFNLKGEEDVIKAGISFMQNLMKIEKANKVRRG